MKWISHAKWNSQIDRISDKVNNNGFLGLFLTSTNNMTAKMDDFLSECVNVSRRLTENGG